MDSHLNELNKFPIQEPTCVDSDALYDGVTKGTPILIGRSDVRGRHDGHRGMASQDMIISKGISKVVLSAVWEDEDCELLNDIGKRAKGCSIAKESSKDVYVETNRFDVVVSRKDQN